MKGDDCIASFILAVIGSGSGVKQIKKVHRGKAIRFDALMRDLTGLSADEVTLMIAMGGAYVGKQRCKDPEHMVRNGNEVSAYYRLPLVMDPPPFDPDWVLDDGPHLLVAAKPSGLPTQGRRDADFMAFYELLKGHLDGYIGLHHRLDQDTSGLMLFTRSREANSDAARLFAEGLIQKTYLAVVQGEWTLDDETLIDAPIGAVRQARGTRHQVLPGGKPARTQIKRLASREDQHLIAAMPLTGRTHQIRVHLAAQGLPLRGDRFYGGVGDGGFLLHCAQLRWPKTGILAAGHQRLNPPESWRTRTPLGDLALNLKEI